MEEEKDRYLEAARIVAECKPSKLPYVLAILRLGGIEIEREPQLPKVADLKGNDRKAKSKSEIRRAKDWAEWYDTEDPTVLALRDAFKNGMNIYKFAAVAELPRTATYKILIAKTPLTDYYRKKVEQGLSIMKEIE